MKDNVISKKNKKLFLELDYLYAELDYFEENLKEAISEFKEAFFKYSKENNLGYNKKEEYKPQLSTDTTLSTFIEIEEDNKSYTYKQSPNDTIQEEFKQEEKDKDLNKLFKKIASITHPDAIPVGEKQELKQKRIEQFIEAQKAHKDKNWYRLCTIAISLGLEIPQPKKEHLKWMEQETTRIRARIEFIKTTFTWLWYNEEDEEKRQNIMKNYFSVLASKN